MIGNKNIRIIPVTLTIVIDIPFSLSSAPIIGAVAAIAEEPHTALPLAIIYLKLSEKDNFFPIYKAPIIVIDICNTMNITPENPISDIVDILNVAPNNTIEYDNKSVSENLYPF